MAARDLALPDLAEIVGMRKGALAARIRGDRRWTAGGLLNVADALDLDTSQVFHLAAAGGAHLAHPCIGVDLERVG